MACCVLFPLCRAVCVLSLGSPLPLTAHRAGRACTCLCKHTESLVSDKMWSTGHELNLILCETLCHYKGNTPRYRCTCRRHLKGMVNGAVMGILDVVPKMPTQLVRRISATSLIWEPGAMTVSLYYNGHARAVRQGGHRHWTEVWQNKRHECSDDGTGCKLVDAIRVVLHTPS